MRHGRDVLRYIRFYTKNSQDAEDLTQEVFIRAFTHRSEFRRDCDEKTWLLRIACNVCRNDARWQQRHPSFPVDTLPDGPLSLSAEDEVFKRYEESKLVAQVCALPIKLKEVVVLRHFEGRSVKEIARILGILETTVKVRLLRAKRRMHLIREDDCYENTTEARELGQFAPSR